MSRCARSWWSWRERNHASGIGGCIFCWAARRACEPQASTSRVSGGGIDDPKEEAETLRAGAWGELRCRRRDGPLLEKREKWGTPVSDWSELRDEPHNHRTLGEGGHPPGCGKRSLPRSLRPVGVYESRGRGEVSDAEVKGRIGRPAMDSLRTTQPKASERWNFQVSRTAIPWRETQGRQTVS